MGFHSKLGASKAARWLNCPGSVPLCETVPEPPPSKYAELGSAAHALAEQCLIHGGDAFDYWGEPCPEYPDYIVDTDMVEAVQVYVDHCRSLMEPFPGERSLFKIEHKFWLAEIDIHLFGTADFVAYDPRSQWLHVADYKHGAGVVVDVRNNPQILYYALGAIEAFGEPIKGVTLHVVQPRAPGKAVKEWVVPKGGMQRFRFELIDGLNRVHSGDDTLKAGDWCRFCPAKTVCPAHGDGETKTRRRDVAADFGVGSLDFTALDERS
jgi:hypothetical protein